MNRYQYQVPLGGLPINLMLVGNREQGRVVFVRVAPYNGDIIDMPDGDGVAAAFGEEGFALADMTQGVYTLGEYFRFNTLFEYKSIPLMLRWLQQQKLEQPV